MTDMNKTYVLYHSNCADGFGASLAARLKYGTTAEYIPVNYGQPVPAMEPKSYVFIVDFSYPASVLRELAAIHEWVTVLDHHKTAQAELGGLSIGRTTIVFDMEKSGAVLAWEHFFPKKPVPPFFLYLQDRDLWQWKLPKSREVSCAVRSYPMNAETWQAFLATDAIEKLMVEGEACLRLTDNMVNVMAKNHRWVQFYTEGRVAVAQFVGTNSPYHGENDQGPVHIVPCANATVFFSEVGERLLQMYPDAKFAAYYLDRKDGKRQWGLRGRDGGFDTTIIAKALGGGGHAASSGYTTTI